MFAGGSRLVFGSVELLMRDVSPREPSGGSAVWVG